MTKETIKFLTKPAIGKTVKVYRDKYDPPLFGVIKDIKVVEQANVFREVVVLEPCDEIPLCDTYYFFDDRKVIFEL